MKSSVLTIMVRVGCCLPLGAVCRPVIELQWPWTFNSSSLFPASGMIGVLGWSASQHWSWMFVRLFEMFSWMVLFKSACHRFKFPATEIGNAPADFSGSRVRQGEPLNILSLNPKVPCNASICLQEEWRGAHRTKFSKSFSVADEVSSGVIWTSVCMKSQKGGRGKVRDREDLLMLTLTIMIVFWVWLCSFFEMHFSFPDLIFTLQTCPIFNPLVVDYLPQSLLLRLGAWQPSWQIIWNNRINVLILYYKCICFDLFR